MKLYALRRGTKVVHPLPEGSTPCVIGRNTKEDGPDIDLSPDLSVSRRHARIWQEEGKYWVEDLGSRMGTFLNGVDIRPKGRQRLGLMDELKIGETTFRLMADDAEQALPKRLSPPAPGGGAGVVEQVKFSTKLLVDATPAPSGQDATRLLKLLQETATAMARSDGPAEVAQMLVRRVVDLVKAASHAALLIVDPNAFDLVLAAHEPEGDPRVSATLVRQAIEKREALVWVREKDLASGDMAVSIDEQQLENVLCAPLIWQSECLGALWLSGPSAAAFSEADLNLVVIVAQHTAMAVAVHRLRTEFDQTRMTLGRIMRQFSPRVGNRLLDQARQGKLRPGGVQSQVTLLCCDLRGFTKTSASMSADDVVDMLNCYFSELVSVLLRHGGTIDKYIGDAILAVFGSPEHDPEQQANAVTAAKEMQQAMRRINDDRTARNQPALDLGIGIHCGSVLHGFIGSEERFEFTVIGDAVNKASRFCDGAGAGEIVISPEMHQIVWRIVKAQKTEIKTRHGEGLPAFLVVQS